MYIVYHIYAPKSTTFGIFFTKSLLYFRNTLAGQCSENLLIYGVHFVVGHVEISGWIPVCTLFGVIVQGQTVGVKERTFQALAGLPLAVTLVKNAKAHVRSFLLFQYSNYSTKLLGCQPKKFIRPQTGHNHQEQNNASCKCCENKFKKLFHLIVLHVGVFGSTTVMIV